MKNDIIFWFGIAVVIVSGMLTQFYMPTQHMIEEHNHEMEEFDVTKVRMEFISQKEAIMGHMLAKGKYRCCLEKPCTYCIEKDPGHGKGAECSCLDDLVNGVHPCGECIGEILEGHGNPYLAEYFAKAIAEKTGQEEAIKLIIKEKYGYEEQA